VLTIEQAKATLLTGTVVKASLDHDLGCFAGCLNAMSPDEWLEKNNYQSMPLTAGGTHCNGSESSHHERHAQDNKSRVNLRIVAS
jgi:hypothetical protein